MAVPPVSDARRHTAISAPARSARRNSAPSAPLGAPAFMTSVATAEAVRRAIANEHVLNTDDLRFDMDDFSACQKAKSSCMAKLKP